jgi:hypothetical protein
VAEIAFHQGIDLYSYQNSALLRIMEFHAFIINRNDSSTALPIVNTYTGVKNSGFCNITGIVLLPVWEIGFQHYSNRMSEPMAETERLLLNKIRPEGLHFHCEFFFFFYFL